MIGNSRGRGGSKFVDRSKGALLAAAVAGLVATGASGAPRKAKSEPPEVLSLGQTRQKINYGPAVNVPSFFEDQLKQAEGGNASAMWHVGLSYSHGSDGVTKDDAKAFAWFRKSAGAGFPPGMRCLALAYQQGRGTAPDGGQAVRWFTRSFEAGEAGAATQLGTLYRHGTDGVEKDPEAAVRWSARAAEAGDAAAASNLGQMYLAGVDVPRDTAVAEKWIVKASENSARQWRDDGTDTYLHFHRICLTGEHQVRKDPVEAFKWARRAADKGNAQGMSHVGMAFFKGEGVEKDRAQAAKWFRMAAERGDVTAMRGMAFLYREGDGVTRNLDESRRWENRAVAAQRVAAGGGTGPVVVSPGGPATGAARGAATASGR